MNDVLMLSRLQFAAATAFHYLFVPLTLGLSILLAIFETKFARSGDEDYRKLARFFGKLFLINFALGVVTGITLEFQFGTNWARYSIYVGDIFGALLAIEATVAFFLESTFIAVWAFGWKKLSPKAHAAVICIIAVASSLSAIWILIANAWMQHPVGYVFRNGRAELQDFVAVATQRFAFLEILHTLFAAYILAGFFVMGVSSYHILKKKNTKLFMKSFRIAAVFAFVFSVAMVIQGHIHGSDVAHAQPTKLAAMEAHWETQANAPMYLFSVPDVKNERNAVQLFPIPGMLSLLSYHDRNAVVKGLKDFPKEDRPPVLIPFLSFKIMVGLGFLFVLLSGLAVVLGKKIESIPLLLRVFILSIPLPYIANETGWMLAEVGRQPWIVYGVMRTADAVSPIAASQVAISLAAFIAIYGLLGAVDVFLLYKYATAAPESDRKEGGRK